jgi:hypothetical protein
LFKDVASLHWKNVNKKSLGKVFPVLQLPKGGTFDWHIISPNKATESLILTK